jgi:hypothetical protein
MQGKKGVLWTPAPKINLLKGRKGAFWHFKKLKIISRKLAANGAF